MTSNNRLRAIVISAAMGALALALPPAFHMAGLGSKFLPLLLPLLINGFLVPFRWAVLTGVCAPLISALATGMPPLYPPVAVVMSVEGAVLGGVPAALYRGNPRRLWPVLVTAVVAGRLVSFGLTWLLARAFSLPAVISSFASVAQGLPGVVLQLVLTPLVVRLLAARGGPLWTEYERQA